MRGFLLIRTPATGSLLILRHFVNTMEDCMEDKKPLVMSSVNTLVGTGELTLKMALMKLIMAMANNNYLKLEGGQTLIKFIVKQCSTKVNEEKDAGKDGEVKEAIVSDFKTNSRQLRDTAVHIMHKMATEVAACEVVLWPYLLELLCDKEMSPAIIVLAQCITHLATTKRERDDLDYMINFDALVNIPSPQHIMSRLMVLVCVPNMEPELGITIVDLMASLGPVIHPSIGMYWDESCASLRAHLEANGSDASFNEAKWQDSMLRMFKETIGVVEKVSWLQNLCSALSEHFGLYEGQGDLNRVIHRYLGALLSKIEARATIERTIELMLKTVDNASEVERQGCAQGLGLAGNMHLDVVLPKITARLEGTQTKKKSGFFGFGSSGPTEADEKIKATCMLCYGYVSAYANPELILSRLDVHVMHNLVPLMTQAVSSLHKTSCVKAIDLIGKALHVTRLPEAKKNHKLGDRDKLLAGVLKFIAVNKDAKKDNVELRNLGLGCVSTLINLNPPISSEMRSSVFDTILPMLPLSSKGDKRDKEEVKEDEAEALEDDVTITQIQAVLTSLVHMDASVPTLVDMLDKFEGPLRSANLLERQRTIRCLLVVLKKFVSKCVHEKTPQAETTIPRLGHYVAQLIPRVMDSDESIRLGAAENMQAMLYIDQILNNPDNPKPRQEIKLITEIRGRINVPAAERVAVVKDLTAILDSVISIDAVIELLNSLYRGLIDVDAEASVGAAVVMETLFLRQGPDLGKALEELVGGMVSAAKKVEREDTLEVALSGFRALTNAHFAGVMEVLLKCPVPLPEEVNVIFRSLTSLEDPTLTNQSIKHLYDVINQTPLAADAPTPIVQTATAALGKICAKADLKEHLTEMYAPVFCTILMRIGTANGINNKVDSQDAVQALKSLLQTLHEDRMFTDLEDGKVWKQLEGNDYDDGITEVARSFSVAQPDRKRSLLQFLGHFYSQQSYEGQRVCATSMLAEFVNHSGDDAKLLRELIKAALPRVADKITKVRKQALRALGNLVSVWSDDVSESASAVLSSLTSAAEDDDAAVAMEAVASLTKVVTVVEEATMGPLLINICFRMRPAFDRKNDGVRAAGFSLFGELCRFGESEDPTMVQNFNDQVHTNLPILIVHMFDSNEKVREACHQAFKRVAALLTAEIQGVVEGHTVTDEASYDEFVAELAPLVVAEYGNHLRSYADAAAGYYGSSWMCVRGNAAMFSAHCLASAEPDVRRTVNMNALCLSLIKLLKEKNDNVRQRAARGLSLLHSV